MGYWGLGVGFGCGADGGAAVGCWADGDDVRTGFAGRCSGLEGGDAWAAAPGGSCAKCGSIEADGCAGRVRRVCFT